MKYKFLRIDEWGLFEKVSIFDAKKVITNEHRFPVVINEFGDWMMSKKYIIDDGLLVPVESLVPLDTDKHEILKIDIRGRVNYLCEVCKAVTIGQCLC